MAKSMNIGALRDRGALLQRTPTGDSQGGRSTTYTAFASNVHANIVAVAGAEQLQAGAVTATATYVVTLRYRTDVSVATRWRWTPFASTTAKTLEIRAVRALDGGRDWLVLDCVELQP